MKKIIRIHGDNIIECERTFLLICTELSYKKVEKTLISPSTIRIEVNFTYLNQDYEWQFDLLPGFNKAGRARWEGDIFDPLRQKGDILDETPDAIITEVKENKEYILCAIEFCSALQAGNQAWQRSGRAFSTGLTGCPYIYVVDFVKYELDPITRKRKALRFPNAAVPYSYINFSRVTNDFIAQVYVKSESFDKTQEQSLKDFDIQNFGKKELSRYLVNKLRNQSTKKEESEIKRKNFEVVRFLANKLESTRNFSEEDWTSIYEKNLDIVEYCISKNKFEFHKIISQKAMHGKLSEALKTLNKLSIGFASRDMPFGIISSLNRPKFAKALQEIYPHFDNNLLKKISNNQLNLIVCVFKGFKPHGEDNRPDRGILPLVEMLSDNYNETLTILYGPLLLKNYELLLKDSRKLAKINGLWNCVLQLSNFILLDLPVIGESSYKYIENLLQSKLCITKKSFSNLNMSQIIGNNFSSHPKIFQEDDVDTGIHFLFTEILKNFTFEGMCNPPGGDWSGLSIKEGKIEKRWLSLPRVSNIIEGKRPDHVVEIFLEKQKTVILCIESKEKANDLEKKVGEKLKSYITHLLQFVPDVEKVIGEDNWVKSKEEICIDSFSILSAAAYLKSNHYEIKSIIPKTNCDLYFEMSPNSVGWNIEIVCASNASLDLKKQLIKFLEKTKKNIIKIF